MVSRTLIATIFALVMFISPILASTYQNLTQCEELAKAKDYISAGKCYEQFKVWDKCVYYLLRGAREYEKEWNRGLGSYEARIKAIQYYDGYSYTCQYAYGDEALIHAVDSYREWLVNWVAKGGDPPFDMDLFLATLKKKVFPEYQPKSEEKEETNAVQGNQSSSQQVIIIEKEKKYSTGETLAILGGTLVAMIVIYLVLWMYYGRREKPQQIPEYWSILEHGKE